MSRRARRSLTPVLVLAALALAGCGGAKTTAGQAACASTGSSCASLACCTASDVCANSVCSPPRTCAGTGASCAAATDCCNGAETCTGTPKACTLPGACAGTGSSCLTAADCCNGADTCTSHVCTAPAACASTGNACSLAVPCCNGGDSCSGDRCVAPALCGATGGDCSQAQPCCSSVDSCTASVCTPPASCGGVAAACLGDGDCCIGLVCPASGSPRTCQLPPCSTAGGACSLPTDCCAGQGLGCAGNVCVDTATCNAAGGSCLTGADCCTNACANGVCTEASNVCKELSAACGAAKDCCSGLCDTSSGSGVCASPASACLPAGASCTVNPSTLANDCCSAICAGPAGATTCTATTFCKPAGGSCGSPGECCTLSCTSGTCGGTACKQLASACTSGAECCTGVCTSGQCAALPGGNGCRTLFDACTVGAGDCCSENCASNAGGAAGTCLPSYSCHAYYDICFRDEECCSGVCDTSLSSPGRCEQMPGSCTQDGNPCTSGTNCCTRLCLDLGSGVPVCQPAVGCRMTGDYCDKTQACCGGSPDALHPSANPYGVFCDTAGRDDTPPRNDSSTKDDFRCTNGTSCNPPGNICGGSGAVNASQNCCDGKKAVCKPDSNGIYRCFGGCPNDNCTQCPTGYDANDPLCCIQPGTGTANVCQFRDQCCNGAPCVPDASGVLHCTSVSSCTAGGGSCSGPTDLSCCAPNTCQYDGGSGSYKCGVDTTTCTATGLSCAADADCCSALCRDTGSGLQCVSCIPNGVGPCSAPGQCCSGNCDPEAFTCSAACIWTGGNCTADADCCSGLVCNVQPGATSGTCGSPQTCANAGQACNDAMPCCSGTCYTADFHVCSGLVSGCACGE